MTANAEHDDSAETATRLAAQVDAATGKLLATAGTLSDRQARAASLLPGWSRGHVLTHIARNADSLRNLLTWARTGIETPQYASHEARDADIQAGADRPVAELVADLRKSAAALAAMASALSGADWRAEVRGLRGAPHPAWFTLERRLTEVEIHHVDLGAGYRPADWPDEFAAQRLERVAADFSEPGCQPALLRCSDSASAYRIGPPETPPAVEISGPTAELLAWLIGRSTGAALTPEPAGPLPPLPPW